MRAEGFAYRPEPQPAVAPAWNPYGLISPTMMQRGRYQDPPVVTPPDSNGHMLEAMSTGEVAAWKNALLGVGEKHVTVTLPSGRTYAYAPQACTVRAQTAVLGPNFVAAQLYVQDEANRVVGMALTSTPAQGALHAYGACIAERGLGSVTTLTQLPESLAQHPVSPADERHIVSVDADCQVRAHAASILTAEQQTLGAQAVSDDPAPFGDLASALARLGYTM